jgi:hypothetical protein
MHKDNEIENAVADYLRLKGTPEGERIFTDTIHPYLRNLARAVLFSQTFRRQLGDWEDAIAGAVVRAETKMHLFKPGRIFSSWVFTLFQNYYRNLVRENYATKVIRNSTSLSEMPDNFLSLRGYFTLPGGQTETESRIQFTIEYWRANAEKHFGGRKELKIVAAIINALAHGKRMGSRFSRQYVSDVLRRMGEITREEFAKL